MLQRAIHKKYGQHALKTPKNSKIRFDLNWPPTISTSISVEKTHLPYLSEDGQESVVLRWNYGRHGRTYCHQPPRQLLSNPRGYSTPLQTHWRSASKNYIAVPKSTALNQSLHTTVLGSNRHRWKLHREEMRLGRQQWQLRLNWL